MLSTNNVTTSRSVLNEGNNFFDFDVDSGKWSYVHDTDEFKNGINLPSNEQAINIAKDFLLKNKLLKDKEFDIFKDIKVTPISSGDITTGDYKEIGRDVFFLPVIDGLNVYGLSRIIVSVGDNGKIIRVTKNNKDFILHKKEKLKTPEKSFEQIKLKKVPIEISHEAKTAIFDSVKLGYYEDSSTIDEQPYLQPVWVFEGESTLDNGKTEKIGAFVPALENLK